MVWEQAGRRTERDKFMLQGPGMTSMTFIFAIPLLALSLVSGCSQAKEPQAAPKAATPAPAAFAPQTKSALALPQSAGEHAYREGNDEVAQALAGSDDKRRWSSWCWSPAPANRQGTGVDARGERSQV